MSSCLVVDIAHLVYEHLPNNKNYINGLSLVFATPFNGVFKISSIFLNGQF